MIRTYRLKVCGLTQLKQIQELIAMDTDYLGFIFYGQSPRYVLNHLNAEDIKNINHNAKVGVFVNENTDTILETVQSCGLQFIQLHGDEDEKFIKTLRRKLSESIQIIKAVRIPMDNHDNSEGLDSISKQMTKVQPYVDFFLFDTDSKDYGGTGQCFDWQILDRLKIEKPYFLSGGISTDNIKDIQKLQLKISAPYALDINSKFEASPGMKDLDKIKSFISLIKDQQDIQL